MNIAEILCAHASTRPGTPAIMDVHRGHDRTLTFAGLERESAQAAALLRRSGVRPGDGVLLLHPMSAELYTALIGVFRVGAVAMFLDPSAGREHIAQCCSLWPPKALIAGSRAHLLRIVSTSLRRIPLKFAIGMPVPGAILWRRGAENSPDPEIHSCAPETPALLTFTSGSAGRPKAALRTHGFLLEQHRVLARSLRLVPDRVDLTTLPIFVLANLGSGVTSLIPDADLRSPGAIDPRPVLTQIRRHHPVSTAASPAMLERLERYCSERNLILSELQDVFLGGAPVFPKLLEALRRIAPQAEITAVYGSTEAEPIAEIALSDITAADFQAMTGGAGLLAGEPVPEISLRILRNHWGTPIGPFTAEQFAAECLPAAEPGEIVVSGAHVLPGYLRGEGDQETKFEVAGARWHRTADAGYLDARGRVWLLGRCDARIEDHDGVLYPFAVECAAQQHPAVRRAAAVQHQGKRLLAIELVPDKREADVALLLQELGWAKLDALRVFRKLPMDKRHNAKINYPELRLMLGKRAR